MTKSLGIATAVPLALCALAAQPVFADLLQDTNTFPHGSVQVTLWNQSPPAVGSSGLAGEVSIKNLTAQTTFEAWCADIFHWSSTSPLNYTRVPGASYFGTHYADPAKASALGQLATNHLAAVTNADSSGAFQMAVWEIINETQPTRDIFHGSFRTSDGTTANTLAQTWLNSNPLPNAMTVNVWHDPTGSSQDFLVFSVPEPETWAMMIAGLGLMGFCASRRKT